MSVLKLSQHCWDKLKTLNSVERNRRFSKMLFEKLRSTILSSERKFERNSKFGCSEAAIRRPAECFPSCRRQPVPTGHRKSPLRGCRGWGLSPLDKKKPPTGSFFIQWRWADESIYVVQYRTIYNILTICLLCIIRVYSYLLDITGYCVWNCV